MPSTPLNVVSCVPTLQIGSSATLAAACDLSGSFVAYTSIVLFHGTFVTGNLIALGAAITLDDNTVVSQC